MKGKTVVVTGANGYVGRHVLPQLKSLGAKVIAIDIQDNSSSCADEQIVANILDESFEPDHYLSAAPDACLHLAWRDGFKHNSFHHVGDLSGHYRFLCRMLDYGTPQLAVMGTMHEVGYWEGAINEDTPCTPQSLYGVAKDALRRALLLEQVSRGFVLQWLRGFYIFGDDEYSQSIFGKILRAAKSGDKAFPFTSGRNKYDFISVDTLGEMIAHTIMQDQVTGIINCCSGEPISLADMVNRFIKENDLDIELRYGAYPDRPYDSPGVWGNADKIRKIMSFGNDGY